MKQNCVIRISNTQKIIISCTVEQHINVVMNFADKLNEEKSINDDAK